MYSLVELFLYQRTEGTNKNDEVMISSYSADCCRPEVGSDAIFDRMVDGVSKFDDSRLELLLVSLRRRTRPAP